LVEKVQTPNASKCDDRPRIGNDHTSPPRLISLPSSCVSSSGRMRMAGTR
jgi:hypothetical protein